MTPSCATTAQRSFLEQVPGFTVAAELERGELLLETRDEGQFVLERSGLLRRRRPDDRPTR